MSAPTTTLVTNRPGIAGYSSVGQQHMGSDSASISAISQGREKGGLRGAGLLAAAIIEFAIRDKANDLTEDYYKQNKKDYDFFKATHQPAMAASVNEAMAEPTYTPDYFASMAAGVSKAGISDKQWFETRRRMHRYAIGRQQKTDYDFALVRAHAVIAGWNIGRRYEYTYAQLRNNRRFDRRIGVANIGIGVGNIVRHGLAAATGRLATAYDSIGDTVASIGNGFAAYSGYKGERQDTKQQFNQGEQNA